MKTLITLENGFSIRVDESGTFKRFFLYKEDLYIAYINEDVFDKNIITFQLVGQGEERAFCKPHDIIQEADNRACEAFNEYFGERKTINVKTGWVTKTQYWHHYTCEKNEVENKFI